jgi:hypothetical protein
MVIELAVFFLLIAENALLNRGGDFCFELMVSVFGYAAMRGRSLVIWRRVK